MGTLCTGAGAAGVISSAPWTTPLPPPCVPFTGAASGRIWGDGLGLGAGVSARAAGTIAMSHTAAAAALKGRRPRANELTGDKHPFVAGAPIAVCNLSLQCSVVNAQYERQPA